MGMYPRDAVYVAQQDITNETYKLDCVKTMMAGASVFPTAINDGLKLKFSGLTGPIRQALNILKNKIF